MNPKSVVLAVFGPFIAAGSAWLCSAVGKYGVHLDKSGVNALAVAGATAAVGLILKLIHELERKQPAATAAVESAVVAVKTADPQLAPELAAGVNYEAQALAGAWPSPPPAPASG